MTDYHSADISREILASIMAAREQDRPVYINGGGSKRHMVGRDCDAQPLEVAAHSGVVDYQPGELVLTARAGTTIAELEATLASEGQTLPCQSPLFDGRATLGGTLASNISGPSRPWSGSIRDLVLGVKLINGHGELLNFGGKVMKNVAGYDVSRLQAGALGTLGVMTEISLKVLPLPELTLDLCYEMDAQQAIDSMNQRAAQPKPLAGAFWHNGVLHLRLAGAASAVQHTAAQWGGDSGENTEPPWGALREMSLPFFQGDEPLWRFSIGPTTAHDDAMGPMLIDWCGAQRWLRGDQDRAKLEAFARKAGGHVALLRGGDRRAEVRPALNNLEKGLQQRLKHSFDPDGIFNPGRLYSWL